MVRDDLEIFFSDFAKEVEYIGEEAKKLPAIFRTKSDLVLEGMSGVESSVPVLLVKREDVPYLHIGDIFVVDGVRYSVIQIEYSNEYIFKAYLSKDKRPLF